MDEFKLEKELLFDVLTECRVVSADKCCDRQRTSCAIAKHCLEACLLATGCIRCAARMLHYQL